MLVFFEKPKKWLVFGKLADGSTGITLGAEVVALLPKHSEDFLSELEKSSKPEDQKALKNRMAYPPDFRLINYSLIKNASLMFIEATFESKLAFGTFHQEYIRKHKNRPSTGLIGEAEFKNEKTKVIRQEIVSKFREDKELWQPFVHEIVTIMKAGYK